MRGARHTIRCFSTATAPPAFLGVGVDVCALSRIGEAWDRFGERFLAKAYHPNEVAAFHRILDGGSGGPGGGACARKRCSSSPPLRRAR